MKFILKPPCLRMVRMTTLTYFLWLFSISSITAVVGNKLDPACDSKHPQKCQTTKPTKPPNIPKTTSFDEWEKWATLFPTCNPHNNPFLSPINIETKKAIPIDEQTLIVYSGDPVDVYTYSSLYKFDNVAIEALNIGLRSEEVYREATYIAGLGNSEYRFFQRAMLLFTNIDVENERSVHQIDGKKFPLELVFFFKDVRNTDETQIHVMVEFTDAVSPAWFWVGDATVQLNQQLDTVGTDNEEKDVEDSKKNLKSEEKILKSMLKVEISETGNDTYEATYRDLELLYSLVASAEDTKHQEKKRKELVITLKKEKNLVETVRESIPKIEAKLQVASNEVERQRNAGELQRGQESPATDLVSEFKEKKATLVLGLTQAHDRVLTLEAKMHDLDNDINGKKALLKKYKIGKDKGDQYKSVKQIDKKRKKMKEQLDKLISQQDKMNNAQNELDTRSSMAPRNVIVPVKFQMSWLFPDKGGYYRYNGSGVVPPCKKRTHVIVMETPIAMEKLQFSAFFTQIHKGRKQAEIDAFTGDPNIDLETIDRMIPPLRQLGNRQIWYNKKRLQFKLDDGWHMKSSLRRKIKDEMRQSTGSTVEQKLFFFTFLATRLVIALLEITIDF